MRTSTQESSLGWDVVAESTYIPEKVSRAELEKIVDECLEALTDHYREVILLRDYAGADWDFIAKELDRSSVGAAQQLHRRARVELAAQVQKRM